MQLKSLTFQLQLDCPPAAWLGLSQLQTLRGVSLGDVPATTIASALPRLHTLHLRIPHADFPVAPFYHEGAPAPAVVRRRGRVAGTE
jgi:hypothetical protein